ncbi:hypothetical protein Nepgr_028275 [Nepenthes gracilis]|uniref:Uncharacterized protein n=1 Tax=Nepenthes gracilis TaxID=150966 RepID=A0AAD3TDE9_NEPGR|nr:hypothetical protein Nepgr_028275 [Nepenthes gracilis]
MAVGGADSFGINPGGFRRQASDYSPPASEREKRPLQSAEWAIEEISILSEIKATISGDRLPKCNNDQFSASKTCKRLMRPSKQEEKRETKSREKKEEGEHKWRKKESVGMAMPAPTEPDLHPIW